MVIYRNIIDSDVFIEYNKKFVVVKNCKIRLFIVELGAYIRKLHIINSEVIIYHSFKISHIKIITLYNSKLAIRCERDSSLDIYIKQKNSKVEGDIVSKNINKDLFYCY